MMSGMAGWVRRASAREDMYLVSRPVAPSGGEFPLAYLRSGPPGATPVVVLPGGPGLGSVAPYRAFRRAATTRGLDLIMIEHRGVGLSRRTFAGADLPIEAVTIERAVADVAAVLDHARVDRAVVYGSSYGTYLAQGVALRHPERVAGMVLDSTVLSAHDVADVRANLRRLLWDGVPATAGVAAAVRAVVAAGVVPVAEVGPVVQIVYEFAGPAVLERLLTAVLRGRGRWTWRWLAGLGAVDVEQGKPFVIEPDLVAGIAYGELGYGAAPDGHPLDPQTSFATSTHRREFVGEPYDLPAALARFAGPLAVVAGERDLRTPRPIAERAVGLAPDAVLVPLAGCGHSALDTHRLAALHVAHAVAAGGHRKLPALAARIAALPRGGGAHLLGPLISARLRLEGV